MTRKKKSSNLLLSEQIRIRIIREISEKAYDSSLPQFLIGLGKICNAQIEPSTSKSALPKLDMTNSTSEVVGLQLRLPVTSSFIISWYSLHTGDEAEKCLESPITRDSRAGMFLSEQMNMHRDTTGYQNPPSQKMTVHMYMKLALRCG